MTVGIAYSPGCYGTYLEWCLTTLTSSDEISAPFLTNGNSHGFQGNFVQNIFDHHNLVDLIKSWNFFRFHPKYKKGQSLSRNLSEICQNCQSLIHLYPDKKSVLLIINNLHAKIYDDWWSMLFDSGTIDQDEIYKNWPVGSNCAIGQVPRWVQREFLSFYLMPAWFDQIEWYHPETWQHENCQVITVRQLLDNFENTLIKLEQFCNLKYQKPVSVLLDFHQENLQNQQYLDEDDVCCQIVGSVIKGKNFSWSPRSLASEAWIQWQLRNSGYEIQCHELDTLPTNSVQLKELIYPV